jgi:hypothetical protein
MLCPAAGAFARLQLENRLPVTKISRTVRLPRLFTTISYHNLGGALLHLAKKNRFVHSMRLRQIRLSCIKGHHHCGQFRNQISNSTNPPECSKSNFYSRFRALKRGRVSRCVGSRVFPIPGNNQAQCGADLALLFACLQYGRRRRHKIDVNEELHNESYFKRIENHPDRRRHGRHARRLQEVRYHGDAIGIGRRHQHFAEQLVRRQRRWR